MLPKVNLQGKSSLKKKRQKAFCEIPQFRKMTMRFSFVEDMFGRFNVHHLNCVILRNTKNVSVTEKHYLGQLSFE